MAASALKNDSVGLMALINSSPEFVRVPSPKDRAQTIEVRVDPGIVKDLASARRRTKLYELFYNVAGMPPPVNNIGAHETDSDNRFPDNWGGLSHAHALFKGLERPLGTDRSGDAIFVYLLRPRYTYEYVADMVCPARRMPAPDNAVFAVYARFDSDFEAGTILNWEWVKADAGLDESLPDAFSERYDRRVW